MTEQTEGTLEDTQTEEVCYVSNQRGYNKVYGNYSSNPNLSYRSTNVENSQDQVYPPQQGQHQGGQQTVYFKRSYPPKTFGAPNHGSTQAQAGSSSIQDSDMKTMLQQIIKGQASGASELNTKLAEINSKVDCSYNDLNKKLESLNSKVQQLEAKSSNPSSSKGMLSGKPIPNPKEYVQAITLKSGRVLPECVAPARSNEDIVIQEEEESVDIEADDSIKKEPAEPETHNKKNSTAEPSKGNKKMSETLFVPPPFKPMLHFPTRFKKQMAEKCKRVFNQQMSEIILKIPIIDAFMMIKPYQKFLKDARREPKKSKAWSFYLRTVVP
ncbi:unnamed protein product [Microthlaspi erraticum]|uniref:Uncharacterized protein n=1 Tax=Microthlaspi erraticum TaxID=1685480 RepID=A0A6D2KMF8_9BRAS|nr:unnamed protein product [Microthlaspi erraticum]